MEKTVKANEPSHASATQRAFFSTRRVTPFFPQTQYWTPAPHSIQRDPEQSGATGNPPAQPAFPAVTAPAQAPTLATPGPSQATAICGAWQTAPDRDIHSQCVFHVQFVEAMQQSRDNIRAVGTPYSTAIADFYTALLAAVPLSNHPAPGRAVRYSYSNLSITVSSGVTLSVPNFELILEQDLSTTRSHGAILGHTLTLNEMPPLSTRSQAEIERTLYHEMIHFISGEIDQLNRTRRQAAAAGGPPAQIVHPEFDSATYAAFQPILETALEPVFLRALQQYAPTLDSQRMQPLATAYAGLQWVTWLTEAIARIEEAVYLARRAGRGFTQTDLTALPQAWLSTAPYWRNVHVTGTDLQTHITSEQPYITQNILPIVRQIQTEYLRRRP